VIVLNDELNLSDISMLLFSNETVGVDETASGRIKKAYDFLKDFSENKVIYGINTGFGPMTQYRIDNKKIRELQYNLIRSHCAGCSDPLPEIYVKSAMISRLNSFVQGHSGIHIEVVDLLVKLINNDVIPYIPEHGGVGASGDLVQLSHIALVLIGEGEVFFKGKLEPTAKVFSSLGLKPISIHVREGLSLINGTSVMTGIGIINLIHAKNLLEWMILACAMMSEIESSFDDYYSVELNRVKLHEGQRRIASIIEGILSTSGLIKRRPEHLYNKKLDDKVFEDKIQEYYSIRCVPQILGPIYDTLACAEHVVMNEFHSVSDNPVIDVETRNVYHGGNFHGDYVSFEMDKVKIAVTKLSLLSERQLNYLMNNNLNMKLPPFVNLGILGLNLGMQGVQFTAVSTAAENQTLSYPMYLHTIPNNNDNQDIVSMGTNSALLAKKVIENAYEVVSIQFMAIIQAIEFLKCRNSMAEATGKVFDMLSGICPPFVEDTTKYRDIANMKKYLMETRHDDAMGEKK
jgi:histidine ammonia-lyase